MDERAQLLGAGMANGELLLEGEMLVGYVRVLELRKLCGRTTHPRLSVRKADAALCTAVVELLIQVPGQRRE